MSSARMEQMGKLGDEIKRLLECPYPAALVKLHEIVHLCTTYEIQTWSNNHPCQVRTLASLILESLGVWSYVPQLVARLCASRSLQRAFLEGDSTILDGFLTKANTAIENDDLDGTAEAACIGLLSYTPPDSVPLPASAEKFFLNLVERAVKSPTAVILQPIYVLIKGGCRDLLDILPAPTLAALADDMFRILRSITSVEGEPLYMLCLSIVRVMAGLRQSENEEDEEDEAVRPLGSEQVSLRKGMNSVVARAYFAGPKAAKTLQLVALQVMWAYKAEDAPSSIALMESLQMASDIVDSIDMSARNEWAKANIAIVRKICDKASRTGLSSRHQVAGAIFTSLLTGSSDTLPVSARKTWDQALIGSLKSPDYEDSSKMLAKYIVVNRETLGTLLLTSILDETLQIAIVRRQGSLHHIKAAAMALREIGSQAAHCEPLRVAVASTLDPEDTNGLRTRLMTLADPANIMRAMRIPAEEDICSNVLVVALQDLADAMRQLVVSIVLQTEEALCISKQDALSLLCASRTSRARLQTCRHSTRQPPRSVWKSGAHESTRYSSRSWTERLQHELQSDQQARHTSIVRLVNEVCEDLQHRCDTVEEPLREARAENRALAAQRDALQKDVEAKHKLITEGHRQLTAQALEFQETTDRLDKSDSTSISLLARITKLEQSLQEAQETAQTELNILRREHSDKALVYQGEVAAMNEDLEDLREQLNAKMQALDNALIQVTALTDQLDEEQQKATSLSNELNAKQTALAASNAELNGLQEGLTDSRSVEATVKGELRAAREEITRVGTDLHNLQTKLDVESAAHIAAVEAAEASHRSVLEKRLLADRELRQQHAAALKQLEHDLEAERLAHETTRKRLQAVDLRQQEQAAALEQLEHELLETHAALQEAQDMRARLMQAMGLPDEVAAPPTAGQRRSRRTTAVKADAAAETAAGSQPPIAAQRSFESGTSSSGGPTPKRTKPRASFVLPQLHKAQHGKILLPSSKRTSMPARIRQPLQDTPGRGNARVVSPSKSAIKPRPMGDVRTQAEHIDVNAEELDFDASDLFTSTPFVPKTTADHNVNHETYDETTEDF